MINLSKNPILYSRIKHIDKRHHFIKEQVLNEIIFLDYVSIENQIADIFIKPLREEMFCNLHRKLSIFDPFYEENFGVKSPKTQFWACQS